jgi:hypothetical protein
MKTTTSKKVFFPTLKKARFESALLPESTIYHAFHLMGTTWQENSLIWHLYNKVGTIFHTPQPYNLMADLEIWRLLFVPLPPSLLCGNIFWFGLLVVRLAAHILLMRMFLK